MTWLMFDDRLMCAETGAYWTVTIRNDDYCLAHCVPFIDSDGCVDCAETLEFTDTESEAKARFLEIADFLGVNDPRKLRNF